MGIHAIDNFTRIIFYFFYRHWRSYSQDRKF